MKRLLAILSLCLPGSVVHSDELDNLISASTAIVDQIDHGIRMTGAVWSYANSGSGLTDGSMSESSHISTEQLTAYNNALVGMSTYQAYGNVQELLDEQIANEKALLNESIDVFTDVVVDMVAVMQVQEDAENASNPAEKAEVQDYVTNNVENLQITQEDVDTYNQSVDDIETHANAAAAFTAIAANEDAVAFLQQGAVDNNSVANEGTLTYEADQQWVKLQYAGTNNASAVFLNNNNFGIGDLYVNNADVLTTGSETMFYLTSPTYLGYKCFVEQIGCEE